MQPTPTTQQKLPVFRLPLAAWASVPRNIDLFWRLYWPWAAIIAVSIAAWGMAVVLNSGFAAPSDTVVGGSGLLPLLVMLVALLLAMPAGFVGWHRAIQTGERPSQPIRLDGAVLGYIGYALLIGLLVVLAVGFVLLVATVIAGIALGVGEAPMSLDRLVALRPFLPLAIIPYYLLLSRFSLVLPAIAVGQPMSLADSFRRTRGNTWRLTVGVGLVYLPVAILSGIIEIVGVALPGATAVIVPLVVLLLVVSSFCVHAALSFGTMALARLAPETAAA